MRHQIPAVCRQFEIYGDFVIAVPYGTGHINDTYKVTFNQAGTLVPYALQRINSNVFKEPAKVMENIVRVTEHLSGKNVGDSKMFSRCTLHLLRNRDGLPYVLDDEGSYWRCYLFVENARSYDIIENSRQSYEAARAFGNFIAQLADLPGPRLNETIVDFHNTPKRFRDLQQVIADDPKGLVKTAGPEIDCMLEFAGRCGALVDLQRQGVIPERITHNDTKLNNVLLDDFTGEGICVIDLDTVMPGLVHYDFGDMVRTGTSPAAEDEVDLSKIFMQFDRFESLLRGFMAGAGNKLNEAELAYLPFAGQLITMETASRFLADYLAGDVYFKVHREHHNLDRCRAQLALAKSIGDQQEKMKNLLASITNK